MIDSLEGINDVFTKSIILLISDKVYIILCLLIAYFILRIVIISMRLFKHLRLQKQRKNSRTLYNFILFCFSIYEIIVFFFLSKFFIFSLDEFIVVYIIKVGNS